MNKPWHPFETAAALDRKERTSRSIVFLGSSHDNGGSSVLAENLAAAMRHHGHRVEEWYLFGSSAGHDSRVFEGGPRSATSLPRLLPRVTMALHDASPDAVFGLQALANVVVGMAGRLVGIPQRIATLHNPRDQQNKALMALDGMLGRHGFYSAIVACSQTIADAFAVNGARYVNRLTVIPNGHGHPALVAKDVARHELGLPASGLVLGQIGRLCWQKNQSFSLRLLQSMPDAMLLLVGIGPDETQLKAEIEALGLGNRVVMVPSLPHQSVGLFYSAVDAALFPSRFEGLSLAAIEAIHSRVPLLCADIPSFREMFATSPALARALLLPDDITAWAAQLRRVLRNPTRAIVADDLALLSPRFEFDSMAARYLRLLEPQQA
jgi:glycosyltransferase involved in cell wall biosynthesis